MGFREDLTSILAKKCKQLETIAARITEYKKSGALYRFNIRKKNSLLNKQTKLSRSVSQLNWQVRLAALGGTVALLGNTQDVIAQSSAGPFLKQNRSENPLRNPLAEVKHRPTAVDLDNDGDYDIVAGKEYGYIHIYKNEGDATTPKFIKYYALDENASPIYGYGGAPAFADLNGDGDLDLIFGTHDASVDRILYFTGNGGIPGDETNPLLFTEQIGLWDDVAKTGNPFDGIVPGYDITVRFVNFDGDGDFDALIGNNYQGTGTFTINYFKNDGQGNFSLTPGDFITSPSITFSGNNRTSPELVDLDQDGNLDLITGNQFGALRFFKGNGSTYVEETGAWDPVLKTGNPFDGIDRGYQSAPAFVDLDNDGDLDLVLGFHKYYGNEEYPLEYYENEGNAVFNKLEGFDNPFDGVDVGENAVPFFVDADGNGDLDVIIGGKYNPGEYNATSRVVFLKNTGDAFKEASEAENPFFSIIAEASDGTAPNAVNLDGDPDLEVVAGSNFNGVQYFDKVDGTYEKIEPEGNPLSGLVAGDYERFTFGDLDGDGDLDAFIGGELAPPNQRKVVYLKNTGSASNPVFTPLTGAENPLDAVQHSDYGAVPILVDIDNDGDLDAIITENGYVSDYGGDVFFFENTGSPTNPVFTERTTHAFQNLDFPYNPQLTFVDFDKDGDVDFFLGGLDGQINYYVNSNPAPTAAINPSTLSYSFGSGPIVIDANLTLADTDGDLIARAEVSIQNYQMDDEALDVTTQSPITSFFNIETGVLTLEGLAPLATYEAVLRTVTYDYGGADPGGRKRTSAGRVQAVSRTVDFDVFDADLTVPATAARTISVSSGGVPPTLTTTTISVAARNQASIDLAPLVSDADGNFDPQAPEAFTIIAQPQNGLATINGSILNLDYSDSDFVGNDTMQLQVCDLSNSCSAPIDISIAVGADFIVYNGISPNGDGRNDFLFIEFIDLFAPNNKVSIYNRWGDKVFEMDGYNNDNKVFTGTSDNGKTLSSGVYFYKIEPNNDMETVTGYLTLKR
ncbi:MAG: FG-GAP-like repeat-containing protein [Cyclobacteriaceae bacterium]